MKKNTPANITAYIVLLLCLALTAGVKLLFHACGPMMAHDGGASYMNCHNAEQVIAIIGCCMAALSGLLFVFENNLARTVIALIVGLGGIAAAVIPNTVIKLCMMTDMRCHSVMRPAAAVIGGLTAVCCGVYVILVNRKQEN